MILLCLPLQLSHDGPGSVPQSLHKLLLCPLLFLQHVLDLLEAGLYVCRDPGQLGHGLLQLWNTLRPDAQPSHAVDNILGHRG